MSIVYGMPFEEYTSRPGIRSSDIKTILKQAAMPDLESKAPGKCLGLGSALHCAYLEPQRFVDTYRVYPGRRSGKLWEAHKAANPTKEFITAGDMTRVEGMIRALADLEDAPVVGDQVEVSVFFEYMGLQCKARIDLMHDDQLFDLKTCRCLDTFCDDAQRLYYPMAATFYQIALEQHGYHFEKPFGFTAVESSEPFNAMMFYLPQEEINKERERINGLLSTMGGVRYEA